MGVSLNSRNYDVIILCGAYLLVLLYGIYEDYGLIRFQLQYASNWDLEAVLLVLNYPISLLLIYFLYKGFKFAWVVFVVMTSLMVFTAAVDLVYEWQLPAAPEGDSIMDELFSLLDPQPRLGFLHYLTVIVTYGSLSLFAMRDRLLNYFSIDKQMQLIIAVIPILMALFYAYAIAD